MWQKDKYFIRYSSKEQRLTSRNIRLQPFRHYMKNIALSWKLVPFLSTIFKHQRWGIFVEESKEILVKRIFSLCEEMARNIAKQRSICMKCCVDFLYFSNNRQKKRHMFESGFLIQKNVSIIININVAGITWNKSTLEDLSRVCTSSFHFCKLARAFRKT